MTLTTHILALLCVLIISTGQFLFKIAANALKVAGTFFDVTVLLASGTALAIYGVATVMWIIVLQDAPLSRAYPYMALSFVLVALAGWLFFREGISVGQIAGLGLIVSGLVVAAVS